MKTYLSGSNPSIRVPVRELALTNGERIRLYDTSGPYTDPDYAVDLKQGLPPLRRHWILERDDVEPGAGGRWGLRGQAGPARDPDALRAARRDHAGDGVRGAARGHGARARARRGRARARHHPRQHQPPGDASR